MSTPKAAPTLPVTVLVPTFNRSGYLAEALQSLLDQDQRAAEIIVIDDGSEDDTADVVQRFGSAVRYLRQENSGKSAALNHGLGHATGEFVWIFDDDDIATPDALSTLHAALAADPDAGFSYGLCDKFYGEWPGAVTEPNISYASRDPRALYVRLLEDFFIWQGAMLVRRRCYDAVGPFDIRMARSQDYEMNLRLARQFVGVGVPKVVFHQRHHAGVRGPRNAAVKADGVEAAWKKYNQIIFSEVHASHALAEFFIEADDSADALAERRHATALMQRACIMGRKGLWDRAIADFEATADACRDAGVTTLNRQETAALRRVFQGGARSAFTDASQAKALAKALRAFDAPGHAAEIRGNLLLPVTHRLRKHFLEKTSPAGELTQLRLLILHLAGPAALREYWRARGEDIRMFGVTPLDAPPSPNDSAGLAG